MDVTRLQKCCLVGKNAMAQLRESSPLLIGFRVEEICQKWRFIFIPTNLDLMISTFQIQAQQPRPNTTSTFQYCVGCYILPQMILAEQVHFKFPWQRLNGATALQPEPCPQKYGHQR